MIINMFPPLYQYQVCFQFLSLIGLWFFNTNKIYLMKQMLKQVCNSNRIGYVHSLTTGLQSVGGSGSSSSFYVCNALYYEYIDGLLRYAGGIQIGA